MITKTCYKCAVEKPRTEYPKHGGACKACKNIRQKERVAQRTPEQYAKAAELIKTCYKCAVEKPITEYYKCGNTCKVCANKRQRELWAKITPEQKDKRIRATKEWCEKNKDEINQKVRKLYATNPVVRIRTLAQNKKYAVKNAAAIAARKAARYKALMQEGVTELTDAYVVNLLLRRNLKILKPSDVPQELIEVKRLQIQLLRMIKNEEHK
jgi:hypothetical protein